MKLKYGNIIYPRHKNEIESITKENTLRKMKRSSQSVPDSRKELVKGGTHKWYNPTRIMLAWSYFVRFLDRIFKECDIIYGDDNVYDLSQHKIKIKRKAHGGRVLLIANIIKMIIYNLVPGTKHVKYNDIDHLLVSFKDIDKMSVKMGMEVFSDFSHSKEFDKWIDWVEERHVKPKEDKKFIISKADLSYMYYDKKLSKKQIAEMLKISIYKLDRIFRDYELPVRKSNTKIYISPEKLDDLYYNQDFTINEIAKIFEVDRKRIIERMDKYKMPRREAAFHNPMHKQRQRAFKSVLRKKFRANSIYVKFAREVIKEAEEDPTLPVKDAKY